MILVLPRLLPLATVVGVALARVVSSSSLPIKVVVGVVNVGIFVPIYNLVKIAKVL